MTTPGVADDGGDAPVKDGLPSGGSDAPLCARWLRRLAIANALVGTNANQRVSVSCASI